ncbi:hypothetical protein BC826DRAFT_955661 [Russula brevipes]|nr:hypothetical protein BC826DRAFT_955661 [Russula brevipes]
MKKSSSYSYSKIPSHDLSGLSGYSVDKPVISSPSRFVALPLVASTQALYDEFSKYLASYLAKGLFLLIFIYATSFFGSELSEHRSTSREKLTRLTRQQFHELSTDVYDELMRRNANSALPFLPVREEFHPKRNQARQKLSTLPTSRLQDLTSDVYHDLCRRYPECKPELSGGASLTLPGATYDNSPSPGFPNAPRGRDRDPLTTRLRNTSENPPSVGAVAI